MIVIHLGIANKQNIFLLKSLSISNQFAIHHDTNERGDFNTGKELIVLGKEFEVHKAPIIS